MDEDFLTALNRVVNNNNTTTRRGRYGRDEEKQAVEEEKSPIYSPTALKHVSRRCSSSHEI